MFATMNEDKNIIEMRFKYFVVKFEILLCFYNV